jgi:SAM-dependent methyltransferase
VVVRRAVSDGPVDLQQLRQDIDAEVRARRAAGEYPPGFERELDALFARFAPAEVSEDFDTVLERADEMMALEPRIPVASRNPAFLLVKKVVAKLIGWYHVWIVQQVMVFGSAITRAVRLLGDRVHELEGNVGDMARERAALARLLPVRDDRVWSEAVVGALAGCTGRVLVVECGTGDLLAALAGAGLDAYGVEPRAMTADEAANRGLDVRVDDVHSHLQAVRAGALDGFVLRGIVERARLGEMLALIEAAHRVLAPGGRFVVCSLTAASWGHGATTAEADLAPGRPLQPETWQVLLGDQGFTDARPQPAGEGAFVIQARRPEQ